MKVIRLALMTLIVALGCLIVPAAAQAAGPDDRSNANGDVVIMEAPPGRYCNVTIRPGTACLYADHDARGWSAHYGPCGNYDVPSWLDPGNQWNGGVSSYVDNQVGVAQVRGMWDNTVVWSTINDNRLRNFPSSQNDRAWWVKVC